MPELPDITVYVEMIEKRVKGKPLEAIRLSSPFLLRSFDPKVGDVVGKRVTKMSRLGKRIVFSLEDDLHAVLHLMVAGRLKWGERGAKVPGKVGLAAFDFPDGSLLLTEASTKKRASLYLVRGKAGLAAHDPGGLEALEADVATFAAALRKENHTLKRTLTDPRILSGIGNAYSDEILHRARLSPVRMTKQITDEEIARLYDATHVILKRFTDVLRSEAEAKGWPEKVTAFRDDMAVHGKYRKPCPDCGSEVQRIAYADNETNYCAQCQTGGRLLADRSLSRLMKSDWPRTLDELEELRAR